jgi:cytochrome c553
MRATKAVFFMHKDRPVTQCSIGAAQGKRLGLRVFVLLMASASVFCAAALAAPAPKAAAADTQAKTAASSEFVGAETCATCHEEIGKKFADNPHT